jgi:hypothetical protein
MNITQPGEIDLTAADGSLLSRTTETLTPEQAQALRAAARLLRTRRFRMTVRCDACFEAGRGDGMRGEITRQHVRLECRCRFLTFNGATL